jgi:ankyrin repeat protein
LIVLGADVDARGGHSAATPLWAACWLRDPSDALEMVAALLEAGADPNLPGLFREPPLQRAVDRGYVAVVRRLLDAGADLLATDPFGMTLLMAAARSSRLALAEFLLGEGLEVNAQEDDGRTALMHAHQADMVRLLVAAGADVNAQTDAGVTALMFRDDHHLAAVQALLELGADPTLRESTGKTAREIAVCRKRLKIADLLKTWE